MSGGRTVSVHEASSGIFSVNLTLHACTADFSASERHSLKDRFVAECWLLIGPSRAGRGFLRVVKTVSVVFLHILPLPQSSSDRV
jgi:hypothetical protein